MENERPVIFLKLNSSNKPWSWELLQSLLQQLYSKRLIKDVDWVQRKYELKPEPVHRIPVIAYDDLFKLAIVEKNGMINFLFGNKDQQWEILWNTYSFNKEDGRIEGINTFFLKINCLPEEIDSTSKKLAEILEFLFDPILIEYGIVHFYKEWVLDETVPITIGPMFRAVYWINFLGTDHLNEFDIGKLKFLYAENIKWYADKGLSFDLCKNLSEVNDPAIQSRREKLNNFFKDAIKINSKWK